MLLTQLGQKSCPCGVSLSPSGHTPVPMTWPGCHWCSLPISCIFLDQTVFLTCFAFLLPELFSAPLLHPGEKRARSCFFLSSLGSRTCRATAEIPSRHFIFLSLFSPREVKSQWLFVGLLVLKLVAGGESRVSAAGESLPSSAPREPSRSLRHAVRFGVPLRSTRLPSSIGSRETRNASSQPRAGC